MLLSCLAGHALALDRSALSPEAQALLPDGNPSVVELKDGSAIQGVISRESETELILRVQRSGSIAVGRRIPRDTVATIRSADVAPVLAERLLEWQVDPQTSGTPDSYRAKLALFDEFLQKCTGAEAYDAVKARREVFHDEMDRVQAGMEKVAGVWLPPVVASIKNFQIVPARIREIEQRRDLLADPQHRRIYEDLIEQRLDIARRAPKLMADRLQPLLNAHSFAEAAYETTSLLQFWIEQVVDSEGPAREVLQQMDFSFILNMLDRIMESYRRAELGGFTPPDAPRPRDMLYIPGGYFLMGEKSNDPQKDTFPMRLVYVSPFLMDKYEVTNRDYRRFAEHVRSTGESWFQHPDAPPLKKHDARGWAHPHLSGDNQPVVGVDWFDAFAFARWSLGRESFERGDMKRLPTEAEWEKAARFTDGRTYPWGENSPASSAVNWPEFRRQVGLEMDRQNPPPPPPPPRNMFGCVKKSEIQPPPPTILPDETWEVDKLLPRLALDAKARGVLNPPWTSEDVSMYGILHMAGNAAEWVQDYYAANYYWTSPIKDPQGPERGERRVVRGGSYLGGAETLVTWRRGLPVDGAGMPFIGFRCAKSLDLVKPEDRDRRRPEELSFEELMKELRDADAGGTAGIAHP